MEKARNSAAWTEAGYDLFAEEGLEGLQVERLARILQLNKSGFYHYFGDLEGYCDELLKLHQYRVGLYCNKVREVKTIDPEYLHVLIEFKMPTLFQMQLGRIKNKPAFHAVEKWVDHEEDVAIKQLWCQYMDVTGNSDLAMRYFDIFRSMVYARIGFENFTFPYLSSLFEEAKTVMSQLSDQKAHEKDESLY